MIVTSHSTPNIVKEPLPIRGVTNKSTTTLDVGLTAILILLISKELGSKN